MNNNFEDIWMKWELKRNLYNYDILGVNIWEYIRINVYRIVNAKIQKSQYFDYHYYMKESNKHVIKKMIENPLPLHFEQRDILFVNGHRRQKIDGRLISPFSDGLVELFDYSYYVLEYGNYVTSIETPNIVYFDINSLTCKFNQNSNIFIKVNRLIICIEKDFKIKLTKGEKKEIENVIRSVLANRNRFKIYYRYILKMIKPKVIIITQLCLQFNFYLCEVAKELNIPIVEYMHGISGYKHVMLYNNKKENLKLCPDYYWLFTEFEKKYNIFPMNTESIYPIGNPYHEYRVKKSISKAQYLEHIKTILVLSNTFVEDELAVLAVELSNMLELNEYKVIYKLHPGEEDWRSKYPVLKNANVKVVGSDDSGDIYDYLHEADIIIGNISTVLFEATAFSNRIFIYKKGLYKASKMLYEEGFAELVENAVEIKNKLNYDKIRNVQDCYYKVSKKNINESLKEIIDNMRRK